MTTKRKNYISVEKLETIERVRNGQSKATLFRDCEIPEGTSRGWTKEEKLRSLVHSTEVDPRAAKEADWTVGTAKQFL
jgi:hypothetical protein